MRPRISFVAIAATIVAVTAALPSAQSTAQTRATAGGKVTATGCVERADQLSGATAATNPDPDSLSFVLMKAGTAGGRSSNAKPGSSSRPSAAAGGPLYTLDGTVSTLNPHVGHQVEIIGTLIASVPAPRTGEAAAVPRLKVENVRMIAETCPRSLKTAGS
jgi:hypothetical protein